VTDSNGSDEARTSKLRQTEPFRWTTSRRCEILLPCAVMRRFGPRVLIDSKLHYRLILHHGGRSLGSLADPPMGAHVAESWLPYRRDHRFGTVSLVSRVNACLYSRAESARLSEHSILLVDIHERAT
jgi:hypothetical protein